MASTTSNHDTNNSPIPTQQQITEIGITSIVPKTTQCMNLTVHQRSQLAQLKQFMDTVRFQQQQTPEAQHRLKKKDKKTKRKQQRQQQLQQKPKSLLLEQLKQVRCIRQRLEHAVQQVQQQVEHQYDPSKLTLVVSDASTPNKNKICTNDNDPEKSKRHSYSKRNETIRRKVDCIRRVIVDHRYDLLRLHSLTEAVAGQYTLSSSSSTNTSDDNDNTINNNMDTPSLLAYDQYVQIQQQREIHDDVLWNQSKEIVLNYKNEMKRAAMGKRQKKRTEAAEATTTRTGRTVAPTYSVIPFPSEDIDDDEYGPNDGIPYSHINPNTNNTMFLSNDNNSNNDTVTATDDYVANLLLQNKRKHMDES